MGGGPLLLLEGVKKVTLTEEAFDGGISPTSRSPRTALGMSSDGLVYLLVVDGRSENAGGLAVSELADFMATLGVKSAVNLDGGGSTTFAMQGSVKNHPSDGSERPVASAVCLNQ